MQGPSGPRDPTHTRQLWSVILLEIHSRTRLDRPLTSLSSLWPLNRLCLLPFSPHTVAFYSKSFRTRRGLIQAVRLSYPDSPISFSLCCIFLRLTFMSTIFSFWWWLNSETLYSLLSWDGGEKFSLVGLVMWWTLSFFALVNELVIFHFFSFKFYGFNLKIYWIVFMSLVFYFLSQWKVYF